ncbi:MAG: leucine-rich repeat protein [Paludibacteraceae bacterium]|nr:leucine-rich repeat protein [Paludibacteraceae bacterium]
MKPKFFTLFAALTLSAGALFASDTAVDGIYYDFDDANLTATVTYRGSSCYEYADRYTGDVVIPATVTYGDNTYSVTSIGESAFDDCSGLISITIPNSVTSIGSFAFLDCSGLTSVTIPNSVTSIGWRAFDGCSGLTKTNYTGDIAGWCGINFGGWGSNPTAYSHHLYINDVEVKDLVIPNSVTSIGDFAFAGCSGLTSIVVESGNTTYDSRNGCNAIIETATNTLVVGCQSTIIPNSVTSIGMYAFEGCSGLTSVTIGNSVTSIGEEAFEGCSGLTSVTIGNSVTSIGEEAFYGCTKLINIVCYAAEPPSCEESVFANYNVFLKVPCNNLMAYQTHVCWGSFKYISCIGSTVGLEQIELAGLYTQAGRIVCEGEFRIYDLLGRDVTRLNGSLQGVYVVKTANAAVKVVVK